MTYPIEVARAGADEGAEPSPATLDVVSRIDALAADLEEKRDTDYWRGETGPPGEPGAPGKDADIAGAEAAKDAANNAATNANEAATLANEAADNANKMANTIKQRAEAGEFDGKDGEPGADGHTPTDAELTALINAQGFIKTYIETDPTVPSWAKQPTKPDYDFTEIKNATPISIDYINSL